ncbi:putative conjugation-related ATPase, partial [Fructobacillus fructosus]
QQEKIPYEQVPHSVIVLDEAQNYLQMENAYNLKYIVTLMEQMRKNYAALMLAMPTIEDLGVTNTNTTDAKAKEYYKNIKKMMDLLQYRFFFHLPDSNL